MGQRNSSYVLSAKEQFNKGLYGHSDCLCQGVSCVSDWLTNQTQGRVTLTNIISGPEPAGWWLKKVLAPLGTPGGAAEGCNITQGSTGYSL